VYQEHFKRLKGKLFAILVRWVTTKISPEWNGVILVSLALSQGLWALLGVQIVQLVFILGLLKELPAYLVILALTLRLQVQ